MDDVRRSTSYTILQLINHHKTNKWRTQFLDWPTPRPCTCCQWDFMAWFLLYIRVYAAVALTRIASVDSIAAFYDFNMEEVLSLENHHSTLLVWAKKYNSGGLLQWLRIYSITGRNDKYKMKETTGISAVTHSVSGGTRQVEVGWAHTLICAKLYHLGSQSFH